MAWRSDDTPDENDPTDALMFGGFRGFPVSGKRKDQYRAQRGRGLRPGKTASRRVSQRVAKKRRSSVL
jgi:hypothetical protein